MNYCTNCGTQLVSNQNFCAQCGAQIMPRPSADAGPVAFSANGTKRRSRITTHVPEDGTFETDGTVEFGDLHPNAIWLFFIHYLSQSAILLPLMIIGIYVEPMLALLLGVYLLGHYLVALLMYKNFRFEVTPHALNKEYGIIHKKSAMIPFEQIENVNINRSLIDRMLGMSHLEIETAGSSGSKGKVMFGGLSWTAEGYLPGLAAEEAEELRNLMLARSQG